MKDSNRQGWLKIFDPVRPTGCMVQGRQTGSPVMEREPRPPVRLHDPVTSRAGAAHVMGQINQRQQFALAAVCQHPSKTAAEIEAAIGCRDGRVRKRLKELVRGGFVEEMAPRPCEVTGHNATVYRATQQGEKRGFIGAEPTASVSGGQGGAEPAGALDQSGGGSSGH